MNVPKNLTVEILKSIRDEVRNNNARVDETNARLERLRTDLNQQLEQTRVDLSERIATTHRHIVESENRVATVMAQLAGDLHAIKTLAVERRDKERDLRPRLEKCEADIQEIKTRLG